MRRITKISGKPNSSISVGYWVEGWEAHPPKVGLPYKMAAPIRTSENDRFAWFSTTTVISVDGDVITTKNSKWRMS